MSGGFPPESHRTQGSLEQATEAERAEPWSAELDGLAGTFLIG